MTIDNKEADNGQSKLLTAIALASEIGILAKSYARVAEAKGEHFNIFSILNMETNEEQTHSRFIAELLNPEGRHGMDGKFLELFLEKLEIENFKTEAARVDVEYNLGKVSDENGGRIDILVRSGDRCIVIENKIYAEEQPNQLLRYYNAFDNSEIFFLTLDGSESSQHTNLTNLQINYHNISYAKDILTWLNSCLKEATTIPVVRETIGQYINLIKKLTGQNTSQQMNKDITKSILSDDQRFEGFAALMGAKKEVRDTIFTTHLFPLLNDISNEVNQNEKEKNRIELDLDSKYFLGYGNSWKSFSYKSQTALEKGITQLRFEFATTRGYKKLIYGIKSSADFKIELLPKLENKFKEVFGYYAKRGGNGWILKTPFEGYTNWDNWHTLGSIRSEKFKQALMEKVVKLKKCVEEF